MFTFSPMPHEEAVKRIAGLPLVTREVMDGLLPELRAYAFCVTGLDAFDQLARVRDSIAAVPAGLKTWDKAKREIAAELSENLGGKPALRRAELLLRTHTFRGYAASRYRLLMQQVDVFPFWQYKTHGDGNVRPSHAALNGKIFPAGHPIWQRIFPPWDWGCRCLVVPLLGKDVDKRRVADEGRAPEDKLIYSAEEAEVMDQSGRLPNGVSLAASQTWGSSPWSEPGTVRHTWDLVRKRYADTPEVLAEFERWAAETALPDLNLTVAEWLGGGAVRFAQPMKKSRFGFDVEFDAGEEEALRAVMTGRGVQTFGSLPDVPAPARVPLGVVEREIAEADVEHAAVFSPDGTLRERRKSTRRNRVAVTETALKGGIMTHNHPQGGPPSLQDVRGMITGEALEVRVVTREGVLFRMRPGDKADVGFERLPGYDRRWNAADIVARQGMGFDDEEANAAVQHSLLAWLAERGIIHYEKTRL